MKLRTLAIGLVAVLFAALCIAQLPKPGGGSGGGGAGDVTGPASSVDSEVALFSGTGGKTLKRASATGIAKLTSGVLSAATAGTDYPTVVSAQNSTSDTLTASVISTNETAFSTSYTIPANTLVTGTLYRVTAGFAYTTSGSPPTIVIKMRLQKSGPTNVVLYEIGAVGPTINSTDSGFGLTWLIQGTAAAGASARVESQRIGGLIPTQAFTTQRNAAAPGPSVDTTANQAIQITITYSANTAANSITLRQLVVEKIS